MARKSAKQKRHLRSYPCQRIRTVKAVEPRLHPNGKMVMSVVIDNDGKDSFHENVTSQKEKAEDGGSAIVDIIREAGIVGMGGAAFPTHFKISSGLGKADTVIINGAECEPYITADHRMMLETPEEILSGIRYLLKALNLSRAFLGIEANKKDAIRLLKEKLGGEKDIEIRVLRTRYPQAQKSSFSNDNRPGSARRTSRGCGLRCFQYIYGFVGTGP